MPSWFHQMPTVAVPTKLDIIEAGAKATLISCCADEDVSIHSQEHIEKDN